MILQFDDGADREPFYDSKPQKFGIRILLNIFNGDFMKRVFFVVAVLGLLASCSSRISICSSGADDVAVSFSAAFSPAAADSLRSLMDASGSSADTQAGGAIFSSNEIKSFLTAAGAKNVTADAGAQKISAAGSVADVSKTVLSSCGILKTTPSSIAFSFGPDELSAFYENLTEDAQGSLDLLMIPCLNDEKMTVAEYSELLASVYGQTLADEITKGEILLELKSADSKKSLTDKITLGELFTLTKTKTWSLSW